MAFGAFFFTNQHQKFDVSGTTPLFLNAVQRNRPGGFCSTNTSAKFSKFQLCGGHRGREARRGKGNVDAPRGVYTSCVLLRTQYPFSTGMEQIQNGTPQDPNLLPFASAICITYYAEAGKNSFCPWLHASHQRNTHMHCLVRWRAAGAHQGA